MEITTTTAATEEEDETTATALMATRATIQAATKTNYVLPFVLQLIVLLRRLPRVNFLYISCFKGLMFG